MRSFIANHWRTISLVVIGILLAGYLAMGITIGRQVDGAVSGTQSLYPGEPVEALIALAVSERAPLNERNRAIWALGQLGASEALPTLESVVSGTECDHDRDVCQHELSKAIELCSGSFNLSAVVWRHREFAAR